MNLRQVLFLFAVVFAGCISEHETIREVPVIVYADAGPAPEPAAPWQGVLITPDSIEELFIRAGSVNGELIRFRAKNLTFREVEVGVVSGAVHGFPPARVIPDDAPLFTDVQLVEMRSSSPLTGTFDGPIDWNSLGEGRLLFDDVSFTLPAADPEYGQYELIISLRVTINRDVFGQYDIRLGDVFGQLFPILTYIDSGERVPYADTMGNWSITRRIHIEPDPLGPCLPEDLPRDGIDNDCNGWVDDIPSMRGFDMTCFPDRGCFWFDEPLEGDPSGIRGYSGCGTSGHFLEAERPRPGMLIKGTLNAVYYVGIDGARYVFPSSSELVSWYLEPGPPWSVRRSTAVCTQVFQFDDATIASLSLRGNVPFRPGSVITGVATEEARYVVSGRSMLRPLEPATLAVVIMPGYIGDPVALLPSYVFRNNYEIGEPVTDAADYDAPTLYSTTIDRLLGLVP